MLVVKLTEIAFYTRVVTEDHKLWLFGILREDCHPDGNRTPLNWGKIYWYSAERAVGSFFIQDARISYLFDLDGKITLTKQSKSQVWLKGDLLELSQSIAQKLEVPKLMTPRVKGKMLEFESQLEECYNREYNIRMLPYDSNTNDIACAPSLTCEA